MFSSEKLDIENQIKKYLVNELGLSYEDIKNDNNMLCKNLQSNIDSFISKQLIDSEYKFHINDFISDLICDIFETQVVKKTKLEEKKVHNKNIVGCSYCKDTGYIETGNNDLPCEKCYRGSEALFNVSYSRYPVKGKDLIKSNYNVI